MFKKLRHYIQLIIIITLVVQAAWFFNSCKSNSSSSSLAPNFTPVFVVKNADSSAVQQGIRPEVGVDGIHLEWYTVSGTIDGYKVYRTSTTSNNVPINFLEIADLPLHSRLVPDTVYTDSASSNGPPPWPEYFYRLRAYVLNGANKVLSNNSNVEYFTMEPQATFLNCTFPTHTIPRFTWDLAGGHFGGIYRIRVYNDAANTQYWISKTISSYSNNLDTLTYYGPSLLSGIQYRWRVDYYITAVDTSTTRQGSSSAWSYFTIN